MMNRFYLICTIGALLSAAPASAARYALLIGCNEGGPGVDPLKYAEKDAQTFETLLMRLGGFEETAVTTLLQPDSASLEGQLRKERNLLSSSKAPDADLFLVYFSGHADGKDLLLGNTRYPLRKVRGFLDSLVCGVKIGIFDACRSGAVTVYKGGKRAEPFYLNNPQRIKGQVIIASTSATERAQESESLRGSIFSFYWFAGLRGSADVSGDRKVTLSEAYNYAYRKTLEASTLTGGEAQHPTYRFSIYGDGDIVITDLAGRAGGIEFDKSTEGKFLVLSDTYSDIFADFYKKKNSERYVSLDPGSYTVINAEGGSVGMYNFTIGQGDGGRVELSQSMLAPSALAASRIKGANDVARATLKEPVTSPLSTWSHGFGLGGFSGAGAGGGGRSIGLCFANTVYLSDNSDFFINARYFTGGINLGADAGLDFVKAFSSMELLGGVGAGLLYLEHDGPLFEDRLAPTLTCHVGFTTALSRTMSFEAMAPLMALFGPSKVSAMVGLELRVMWCGKYRDVRVLHY